jgi:Protein of unknown function (DUF4238)
VQAKSQHTIPRLHLQHFAGSQPAGQVWTYDALTGKRWSAIPEETCVQTHFYSAEGKDGTRDTRLEDFLSQVESRAAPIDQSLLKGLLPRNSQTRVDFAQFLALMHCRTTAMRRMAGDIQGRGIQILNYAYASNPEAFESLTQRVEAEKGAKVDPTIKERIRQVMLKPQGYELKVSKESTFIALAASEKLTPIFSQMKWSLVAAGHGYFITSDNPLVRRVDAKTHHPIYGDHGFINKTAEVTFPLSPKLLLLLSWNQFAKEFAILPRDHVETANSIRAAHSDRYLFGHINDNRTAKLAAKYKDSRPTMTTQGYGPDIFAPIKVARHSKKGRRRD